MSDERHPQDADSGLVERTWTRTVGRNGKPGRRGVTAEEPLTGREVTAAWIDPHTGELRRAAGAVRRNDAGTLVIESWADGARRETEVPRDASVDVVPGR